MKKYDIVYEDRTELVHIKSTKIVYVKFGEMQETADGFAITLKDYHNVRFIAKEVKEAPCSVNEAILNQGDAT